MDVHEFDFDLPAELIAQEPMPERDGARLLCLDRKTGAMNHRTVSALPDCLMTGDLLVVNNTRVIPARLLGRRVPSGGVVECMLLQRLDEDRWEALVHPGHKLKPGVEVMFGGSPLLRAQILERKFHGRRVIRMWTDGASTVDEAANEIGHVPLPPYIRRDDHETDRDRYQTVYAAVAGSVAAPTAGLHFTRNLLATLARHGIEIADITLHVGYGTFQPVRVDRVEDHRLEPEPYDITEHAAACINRALDDRRRVIAVGTTTTRALEAMAAAHDGRMVPGRGETDLFIHPGFDFRVVSGLMTNFHLPRSSLLMLVAGFAGRDLVLAAYRTAVAERYRFYSYGDAMLIQ
jgi:S-adenosylmethionine:tRNA ribosyltransferase-isomerase